MRFTPLLGGLKRNGAWDNFFFSCTGLPTIGQISTEFSVEVAEQSVLFHRDTGMKRFQTINVAFKHKGSCQSSKKLPAEYKLRFNLAALMNRSHLTSVTRGANSRKFFSSHNQGISQFSRTHNSFVITILEIDFFSRRFHVRILFWKYQVRTAIAGTISMITRASFQFQKQHCNKHTHYIKDSPSICDHIPRRSTL